MVKITVEAPTFHIGVSGFKFTLAPDPSVLLVCTLGDSRDGSSS